MTQSFFRTRINGSARRRRRPAAIRTLARHEFLNLPPGAATTTIESKTNFFAACPLGETIRTETTPLHRGRTTMVWQTRITRQDGKLAAIVTQTQLVLTGKR